MRASYRGDIGEIHGRYRGDMITAALDAGELPEDAPISPLHLPHISAISPPYLPLHLR